MPTDGLERFVVAQAGPYAQALAELVAGRKRTHWMWFVFPQLRGLGASAMAQRYGIADLDEARRYVAHPLLGPRLLACCRALLDLGGGASAPGALEVLGSPDDLKLRSSMTLFARASPGTSEATRAT